MTQEEIIELARESGMELYGLGKNRARFVHHLQAFAKLIAEKEREEVTKERDRMCEHCKWRNDENSTLDETNQSKVLGKS